MENGQENGQNFQFQLCKMTEFLKSNVQHDDDS